MRAILIDPIEKTITEVEHDGRLDDLHELLGCGCVDALQINGNVLEDGWHSVYFDDEGLLREPPPTRFFQVETDFDVTPPIPGRGLVVSGDKEGNDVDATMTVDEVRARVTFTERRFRGIHVIGPHAVRHPVFGEVTQIDVTADLPIVDGADEITITERDE